MIHPALGLLAAGLLHCKLTVLDLSDNAVNPTGAEHISPLLTQCFTLKELYLNNTGVGPAGGKIIGEALSKACENANAAGRTYALERFILGRSRLEVDGAEALAIAFTTMKSLVEIRVFQNGIPAAAAEKLALSFAANPNLEIVDISDNRLKLQGSLAMAQVIKRCKNLRRLNLSDNLLRHRGGLEVAHALSGDLKKLEFIDLSGNELTPEVGRSLLRHLKSKPNLATVKLGENAFGEDVAEQLGAGLGGDGREIDVEGAFDLEEVSTAADSLWTQSP